MPKILLILSCTWIGVSLLYCYQGNPYRINLLVLAALGALATMGWLTTTKLTFKTRRAVAFSFVILAAAFALFKAPPYRANERDITIQRLSAWWQTDQNVNNGKVWCAIPGFYFFTGQDPIAIRSPDLILKANPGDTIIWDPWAMGRWLRISCQDLENAGCTLVGFPQILHGQNLRIYLKPHTS